MKRDGWTYAGPWRNRIHVVSIYLYEQPWPAGEDACARPHRNHSVWHRCGSEGTLESFLQRWRRRRRHWRCHRLDLDRKWGRAKAGRQFRFRGLHLFQQRNSLPPRTARPALPPYTATATDCVARLHSPSRSIWRCYL